jgi:hypothetical protein
LDDEAKHRVAKCALTAAALADEAERLALPYRKAHVADRADGSNTPMEQSRPQNRKVKTLRFRTSSCTSFCAEFTMLAASISVSIKDPGCKAVQ